MPRVAIDSNILIYAEMEPSTPKGAASADLIRRASRDGVIPVQALGEFLRFIQRKAPASFAGALTQCEIYRTLFQTPQTTDNVAARAGAIAAQHTLQFWDAVICTAAVDAGAVLLLSEDMQDGRALGPLRILNPFNATNTADIDRALRP
jgi:predicted nucleic acid-binding protein